MVVIIPFPLSSIIISDVTSLPLIWWHNTWMTTKLRQLEPARKFQLDWYKVAHELYETQLNLVLRVCGPQTVNTNWKISISRNKQPSNANSLPQNFDSNRPSMAMFKAIIGVGTFSHRKIFIMLHFLGIKTKYLWPTTSKNSIFRQTIANCDEKTCEENFNTFTKPTDFIQCAKRRIHWCTFHS